MFSGDDQSIISGESQQGLFWWNLNLDNLLARGCDRVARSEASPLGYPKSNRLSDYLATNPNVKPKDKRLDR